MLLLVRHGQTIFNAEGRLSGRLDVGLTALGATQAEAVAGAVRAVGVPDLVISSPLGRARATAAALGATVEIDDRWTELDYGELDGRPLSEVPGELWSRWRSDSSFAPPGGESLTALGTRVSGACRDAAEAAQRGLVVVVSHVSPIKAAVAWALEVDVGISWRMFVAPASITRIAVRDGSASLHAFNETGHLAG